MNSKTMNTNVHLRSNPRNGEEAHKMLVASLVAEIEEKQIVLRELQNEETKRKFIRQWTPDTESITICNL